MKELPPVVDRGTSAGGETFTLLKGLNTLLACNGYEQTPELVFVCTQIDFHQRLIEKQNEIIAWCRSEMRLFPPIPKIAADFANQYPDTVKFLDERMHNALDELQRLRDESKILMLKLEAVKKRTPYNPTIPFK